MKSWGSDRYCCVHDRRKPFSHQILIAIQLLLQNRYEKSARRQRISKKINKIKRKVGKTICLDEATEDTLSQKP